MSRKLDRDARRGLPAEQAAEAVHDGSSESCIPNSKAHEFPAPRSTCNANTATARRKSLHLDRAEVNPRVDPVSAENKGTAIDATTLANRTAALRRLNGGTHSSHTAVKAITGNSTTSTQPVLVRTYNSNMTAAYMSRAPESKHHQEQKDAIPRHDLPPLSAFSFQEILAAIDTDVRVSIDTIAEICGRSKMSLANEYQSHLPPHGEVSISRPEDTLETVQSMLHQSLEPVEESTSSHGRGSPAFEPAEINNVSPGPIHTRAASTSWALLGASSSSTQNRVAITSLSVAEPSEIDISSCRILSTAAIREQRQRSSLHDQPAPARAGPATMASEGNSLPNFLAWLRGLAGSEKQAPESSNQTEDGKCAVEALREMLKS
ncbi:hypothetical protein MMC24_006444 [Lignoscripta atroalba]|nr:hypothetical protein [Lignoscripta atroalba]